MASTPRGQLGPSLAPTGREENRRIWRSEPVWAVGRHRQGRCTACTCTRSWPSLATYA